MVDHSFDLLVLPKQVLVLSLRERPRTQYAIALDQISDLLLFFLLGLLLALNQQQSVMLLFSDELVERFGLRAQR